VVREITCECRNRFETKIDSFNLFQDIKSYFENQIELGIYEDILVKRPYYTGYSNIKNMDIKYYTTKWYICKVCGCLWEFNYPDFPAQGFVRKFDNGIHTSQQ
jgi:hypothetical protein